MKLCLRYAKMTEWMDNVEMAIAKVSSISFLSPISALYQVCASKVYTSAEFKREKDNFQSLCKNLERTETKRSLDRFNARKAVCLFLMHEDPNAGYHRS